MESDLTQAERDELDESLADYIEYLEAKLAAVKRSWPVPGRARLIAEIEARLGEARARLELNPPAG